MEIPTDRVPRDYIMNPETDDLLFDGHDLRDGMVVLIAESKYREPFEDESLHVSRVHNSWIVNRWCNIYRVQETADGIAFIGVYGDGVKHKRTTNMTIPWYVKKDSIPEIEPVTGLRIVDLPKPSEQPHFEDEGFKAHFEILGPGQAVITDNAKDAAQATTKILTDFFTIDQDHEAPEKYIIETFNKPSGRLLPVRNYVTPPAIPNYLDPTSQAYILPQGENGPEDETEAQKTGRLKYEAWYAGIENPETMDRVQLARIKRAHMPKFYMLDITGESLAYEPPVENKLSTEATLNLKPLADFDGDPGDPAWVQAAEQKWWDEKGTHTDQGQPNPTEGKTSEQIAREDAEIALIEASGGVVKAGEQRIRPSYVASDRCLNTDHYDPETGHSDELHERDGRYRSVVPPKAHFEEL